MNYVPGPEEPRQAPPLPEFVPKPIYLEFMPSKVEVLLAEEQPLPAVVSPIADSPGYIPEFNPEEDDDEDTEEDPNDYPTNRDDDDEEEEPFKDEADDEDEDNEEEEEHPALADSVPPPPVHRTTAKLSIPAQAPIPFLSEEEVERFLAIPTPPPSSLNPISLPLLQIPSPPLPVLPPLPISPLPLPASPTYPLGFRATMIRQMTKSPSTSHLLPLPPPIILSHTRAPMAMMMAAAPSTYTLTPPSGTQPLLPIPLHTPSPPFLPPSTDRRADRPEVCLPPQKRLCISQGLRFEVRESSFAPRPTRGFRTDYGFVATLDAEIRCDPERDVGYGITDTWDEMLDTYKIYGRLDEAQDARAVLSCRLNLLQRDRRSHAYTDLLVEREARLSCKAWGRSMDASDAACFEVMALRTTMLGQQAKITALRAADRT
ncbi:hypothetical protein Tco_0520441 [Tanacetum coccineum]